MVLGQAGKGAERAGVNVHDWRGTACKIDFSCTSLTCHIDNLSAGGSPHDAIVYKKNVLACKLFFHRVQLPSNPFLPGFLAWHDERSKNISVLHEPLTERFL